jgi:predicted Fe-Mo cluster-binding NifX family protein
MKLALSATDKDMNSDIDTRFGRCAYFLLVTTEDNQLKSIENPNRDAVGGAGIQSAQLIAQEKVDVVITGNIGPNAFKVLYAAGVKIITGVDGKIKDVLARYKRGELKAIDQPNVNSKFGMN